MNNINDFISKIFEGVELTQEERNMILGIYFMNYYKNLLELLLSYRAKDEVFVTLLNNLLNSQIGNLNAEEKKVFTEVMEDKKVQIFGSIVHLIKDKLPPEKSKIIENNLKVLSV